MSERFTTVKESAKSYSVFAYGLIPTGEWVGTVHKRDDGWHIGGFGPVRFTEALPTKKAAAEKLVALHRQAFPLA